jgi:hypothetical protein
LGIQITAAIALFTGHIPADVWGWISVGILGVYSTNRSYQKKVQWGREDHGWDYDNHGRDRYHDHYSDVDEWDRSQRGSRG